MASPQVFINRTFDMFKRHNPLEAMAFSFAQGLYNLVTWNSRMKIYKYKLLLEVEKLERMQKSLHEDPVFQAQTKTMNKVY